MPPSLKEPRERLSRADTHFDELNGIVERFKEAYPNPVQATDVSHELVNVRPRAGGGYEGFIHAQMQLNTGDMELPDGIGGVLGDLIQDVRIPLDYLIYQLAWLDSGVEQDDTQFPIFWTKKAFRGKKSEYLCGVNEAHRYAIELLQPYNGGKWLGTLASIANPDKHRTLLSIGGGAVVTSAISQTVGADGVTEVNMHMDATPTILLPNRQEVVETLRQLKASVRAVVDEFDPCFRGECSHAAPPQTLSSARKR